MAAHAKVGDRRPIALLDSGVGGLTVLHECLVSLPAESFVYFGDTARFPYGDRNPEELSGLVAQVARHLLTLEAKLLVVACNSATAVALPQLEQLMAEAGHEGEVIGVVEPESEIAASITRCGRVGLLATPATVASGAYRKALAAVDPGAELVAVACDGLAAVIQNGSPFDEATVRMARSFCEPLRRAEVDTVILGCTHYPLLAPMLQRILGRDVTLVSSGHSVAARVQRTLERRGIETDATGEGQYSFLCTGDVESFRLLGTRFLQMPLGEVRHVEVHALETAAEVRA